MDYITKNDILILDKIIEKNIFNDKKKQMIVECKNCLKKFAVNDSDIPSGGRTVQCGNCSRRWLQMPHHSAVTTDNLDLEKKSSNISSSVTSGNLGVDDDSSQDLSKNEFMASDGKNYKFLGSQWAEKLPSGKFGRLARKNISKELNKLTSRKQVKKNKRSTPTLSKTSSSNMASSRFTKFN